MKEATVILAALVVAMLSGCAASGTLQPEVPATKPQFAVTPATKPCKVGVEKDGQTVPVDAECTTLLKPDVERLIRERIFYCIAATDDAEGCGIKPQ
jgi:hypothetical protein